MHEETITYLNPPSLTDKEFQLELTIRFDIKVNN